MASTTAQDENKNLTAMYQGILVEVISPANGPPLPMFPDPDSEANKEPDTMSYYIEAKTGERFTLKVTITPQFKTCAFDDIAIKLYIDGGKGMNVYLSKERWLEDQKNAGRHFDSWKLYHSQSGTWREAHFTFGSLKLSLSHSS